MCAEIKDKIRQRNQWYVEDQIDYLEKGHCRHHFAKRIRYLIRTIKKLSKNKQKLLLLDAGCGDGAVTRYLESLDNVVVYGMDYNPLRISRVNGIIPNRVVLGSVEATGFKDDKFDLILLHHVLEHVHDDLGVLNEMHRILKVGGFLIIGYPNEGCFLAQLRNRILEPYILRATDHVHFYTEEKMLDLIEQTDFEVFKIHRIGFFTPHSVLHSLLSRFKAVDDFLDSLGQHWKSNAGALYIVCRK